MKKDTIKTKKNNVFILFGSSSPTGGLGGERKQDDALCFSRAEAFSLPYIPQN